MPNSNIFEERIYKTGWRDHPCGSGSTMANTEQLRSVLPAALKRLNIHTLLDAPCGDHSWISTVEWQHDLTYIGGDIVQRLIDENSAKYPNKEFMVLDIVHDPLPDADMIFVRDCLIHLSNEDISAFLHNFLDSNIKALAATSYAVAGNKNISAGQYRPTNLCAKPFNLSQPIEAWADGVDVNAGPRHMCVWHRSQIELALTGEIHG